MRLGGLVALIMLFSGCGQATTAPADDIAPTYTYDLPSRRLQIRTDYASYDFYTPVTAWQTFTTPGGQASFRQVNEMLEGIIEPDLGFVWSLHEGEYQDVAVQATVRQTNGAPGSAFGVMCRVDARGNGYYFLVSSAGRFSVQVATEAQNDLVPLLDWQEHPAVQAGYESNDLLAFCVRDWLVLFVNDLFVGEVRDSTFRGGQVALALGAVGRSSTVVTFDDVEIGEAVDLGPR